MRSLTRTLALELALLKINVSNVDPGMVLTPFNQEAIEDPRGAREVGAEHPVETSGPTRGGGAPRRVPCLQRRGLRHRLSTYTMDGSFSRNLGQGA